MRKRCVITVILLIVLCNIFVLSGCVKEIEVSGEYELVSVTKVNVESPLVLEYADFAYFELELTDKLKYTLTFKYADSYYKALTDEQKAVITRDNEAKGKYTYSSEESTVTIAKDILSGTHKCKKGVIEGRVLIQGEEFKIVLVIKK